MCDDAAVPDTKRDLHRYLQSGRDALVWKLDGLSERDIRRPMVPTGTNLLGLIKHLASVEFGYFGVTFGRPPAIEMPWWDEDAETNADMWATPDESRAMIVDLYRQAWAHSDETIEALPIDGMGSVPWWPPDVSAVTLHRVLVHVATETHRHAGHADIVRELIDGSAGLRASATNLPAEDATWWATYRGKVQAAAEQFPEEP